MPPALRRRKRKPGEHGGKIQRELPNRCGKSEIQRLAPADQVFDDVIDGLSMPEPARRYSHKMYHGLRERWSKRAKRDGNPGAATRDDGMRRT